MGIKTNSPTKKANTETTRTAAAEASFAFLINGSKDKEIAFDNASIAVLNNSAAITNAMARETQNHSKREIRKSKPKSNTAMATKKWNLKFSSVLKVARMPEKA